MATTQRILTFLTEFGTAVTKNEESGYVDLMINNGYCCIEFNEVQYYISKINSLYDSEDEDICDLLIDNYLI